MLNTFSACLWQTTKEKQPPLSSLRNKKANYFYKWKGGFPSPFSPKKVWSKPWVKSLNVEKNTLSLHFGQVMNQTLDIVFCFQKDLPQTCVQPNPNPHPHVSLDLNVLSLSSTAQNTTKQKNEGEKNHYWFVLSLDSHGTFSTFMPNLPCPPAVWVWVLASWTTPEGQAAASEWPEGMYPGRPRPPVSSCMPGGRVTSIDAVSTSFFRAFLISLSARWSEAWTEVSISDCGEFIPTDKNNSFSLFRVKRKQQYHLTHGNICRSIIFPSWSKELMQKCLVQQEGT